MAVPKKQSINLFTLIYLIMANYGTASLVKAQTKLLAPFQQYELRRQEPTIVAKALKSQKISRPNAQDQRVSPLRQVDVNYFINKAAGSATAKSANHTGVYGDSAAFNVTYVQHVETFNVPYKIGANNVFTQEELFEHNLFMAWKNLRTRHDNSALSYLYSNRCQLAAATINPLVAQANAGTWDGTAFGLGVSLANKNLFHLNIKAFMQARQYTGELDLYADLQLQKAIVYEANQGQGNSTNLNFQLNAVNVIPTQVLIASATTWPLGAGLITPAGALAGLLWNEQLNKVGFDSGDTTTGMLGTLDDPFGSGMTADVSYYLTRSDTSSNGTGGSTQDLLAQYELTVTIGYVLPPLSTASDSLVHLVGQLAV